MAEQTRLYIGENSAIRCILADGFSYRYPTSTGAHLRFDSNSTTGVGYELFFAYGGGLWVKNEQGGGWKELAIK